MKKYVGFFYRGLLMEKVCSLLPQAEENIDSTSGHPLGREH